MALPDLAKSLLSECVEHFLKKSRLGKILFGLQALFYIPSGLSIISDHIVDFIKSIEILINTYRDYISDPIVDIFHKTGIYIYPRTADVLVIFSILTAGFLRVAYKDFHEPQFNYKKTLKKLLFWVPSVCMVCVVAFYNEGWVFTIFDIRMAEVSGWRLSIFDVIPLFFVTLLPMLFYNSNKFTKRRSDIFSFDDLFWIYMPITTAAAILMIFCVINYSVLQLS